jgi:hypothetical protein
MPDIATIKFGSDLLEITNPRNVQPISADLYTECRHYNGIACLSFAALIIDGGAKPRTEIVARIRLTLIGATDLRDALDGLLKSTMPGKQTGN